MELNRNSFTPLYIQIESLIREKIESGEWDVGMKIPSELELSDKFNVSRFTVRKAVSSLVNEGLLKRYKGKGTYVNHKKSIYRFSELKGFTEQMEEMGKIPSSEVLDLKVVKPSEKIQSQLNLEEDEDVLFLYRLRLADNEPMALEKMYVKYSLCENIEKEDLGKKSIYKLLENKYGVNLLKANQVLEAENPDLMTKKLLNINQNIPVLRMYCTVFDDYNQPCVYVDVIYRSDKYVFKVTVPRRS